MNETDAVFDTDLPFISHLTYHEWHSFVNGIANELTDSAVEDPDAQPAYYNAGVVLTYILTDD